MESGMSGLSSRDYQRLKRQRESIGRSLRQIGDRPSNPSSVAVDKHLGDITEALVLIHLGWEAPAYRFETRRQLEAWFRQQEWTGADDLDQWYGIVLDGGQDDRLLGWLAAWTAVGAARVHGLLSSLDRIIANRMVPLASSQ